MDRLRLHCKPFFKPGTIKTVMAAKEITEYLHEDIRENMTRAWHLGRIKHFVLKLQRGEQVEPISIDDPCDFGAITGVPIILDGYHRYAAHIVAGQPTIRCTFGGLVATLRYLQGRRKKYPPDEG